MTTGGGEAADQMVRMMLTGGEVAVRLGGSAAKDAAAMMLALAHNHKTVYGKTSMAKMLRQTRDLRVCQMTKQQYDAFRRQARGLKILYAGVRDKRGKDGLVDLVLPTAELGRANLIFERIGYPAPAQKEAAEAGQKPEAEKEKAEPVREPKKESRSGRGSRGTGSRPYARSTVARTTVPGKESSRKKDSRTTDDRPSVEGRLRAYQARQRRRAPAGRTKTRTRPRSR